MTAENNPTIRSLLTALEEESYRFHGNLDQEIAHITWDYKKVSGLTLYFCLEDEEFQEGHIATNCLDYWKKAVKSGAVCLVTQKDRIKDLPTYISLIEVENLNQTMALIARGFHQDPLADMKVIGITGTNGKTTTSQMLDSIFCQAAKNTGIIGTIGVFFPSGKQEASHLSNPLATELFTIGRQLQSENVEYLTMEVTSHAGAFDRNYAIDFDIAIFTNLTQDHLDYHKTIDSYKEAKLKLFQSLGQKKKKSYGVINIDDATSKDFIDGIEAKRKGSGQVDVITYGIRNKDADLVAYPKEMTGNHSEFDVFLRGDHLSVIRLPMPGLFNIYNALAAFGAAFALGISIEQIVEGLSNARKVDGRFEQVDCDAVFDVYVDYAHTPDSLQKILEEINGLTKKRVIVVFGCGGDRDRTKRPEMGRIASENADICIVTSDNPRTEEPQQIIDDLTAGISNDSAANVIVEIDRLNAIHLALKIASEGDSVLIAGKGHETYQIIGHTTYPFFDRKVVQDFFLIKEEQRSRAWIEISLKNLQQNFDIIFQDKPDDLKVLAVVKDNALGHGVIDVVREAIKAGCNYLGVACLSEALTIRQEFDDIPILIFGERPDDEVQLCLQHHLTLQVQSKEKAEFIAEMARESRMEALVHLKVDTGMGRYGVHWQQAERLYQTIHSMPGLKLEGIMTHFAQSDEADKAYPNLQWERFAGILKNLAKERILPPLVHACNSGGYLDLPHAHGNMVRLGILPCGVYPSKVCRRISTEDGELQPVMSVFTRIAFIKTLQPGDSTGYGMHFTAAAETVIAVLPMGYGDGYPRLRNNGHVLIKGQCAPIVGGNGMDATMVNISHLKDVRVGEKVVLMGKQQNEEITAMMISNWAETVTYDILSRWSLRMDRQLV